MANKRLAPEEEIVTRLRQAEVVTWKGMPRLSVIRRMGVICILTTPARRSTTTWARIN